MLPVLLILSLTFLGLFVLRVGASERRQLVQRWPAPVLGAIAVFALSRGAYSFALLAGGLAVAAWLVWPKIVELSRPATDDPAGAAARALLGVNANASAADIRAAYRAKMAQAHPDRGGSNETAARLTAARDLLLRRRR